MGCEKFPLPISGQLFWLTGKKLAENRCRPFVRGDTCFRKKRKIHDIYFTFSKTNLSRARKERERERERKKASDVFDDASARATRG